MDIFERWFEQDLTKKVGIQHAESLAFSGNNESNVVGVYVYKDGAPAELAGTVTGTVIRPDGMTVPLTGTLSGNAVSAVLTEACFAVPGYIGVALTVTSGDITMTVLKATFEVEPIETSTVVDPSGEITANVAELISDIEAAVATIPPSYSDLLAAVAPTFDPEASTPYQSGAYVWYSGALYCFITDHTGAWTGTDAMSVNVGEEISELKNAIHGESGADIGRILIPCADGEKIETDYAYKKIGNTLVMNGTSPNVIQRMLIHGEFLYRSSSPRYSNAPEWYAYGTCDQFIIGHKYYLGYKLVEGSINRNGISTDFYYDIRSSTNNGGQYTVGSVWECTFVPEMIAFVGYQYTFANAIIELLIYDLTEINSSTIIKEIVGDPIILTDTQKGTARNNIGASSIEDIVSMANDLDVVSKGEGGAAIGRVYLPCTDTQNSATLGTGFDFQKFNNTLYFNGTRGAIRQRFCIFGAFDYRGSNPSPENVPAWYQHGTCDRFIVGHRYYMGYKLVSGTMTQATGQENTGFYFDLRNANGVINSNIVANTVWECTEQPEMVAFCAYNYSYANAVIELEIYDITEMKDNPVYKEVQDEYTVPGYFSSHMATQIAKIQTAINAGKTVNYGTDIETFVFITDVHWADNKKNSPALIKEILNKTSIKTVVCGGDIIARHNSTKEGALEEIHGFTNSITGIPCYDYYAVYGNHDNNGNNNHDINSMLTSEEEYNSIYAPFADKANVHWIWEDNPVILTGTAVKNDYYFDHSRTKTRYICIDWKNPFQNTNRATWLTSVLSKDDGYRVVIIYHGMYAGSEFTPEHTQIMQYIEPYKNKVVAVITGHTHVDNVIDYFGDGSVPVIITPCDTFDPTHNTGMVAGAYTEQCFDVFVVDYTNRKIKIIRIGNGNDREVNISLS